MKDFRFFPASGSQSNITLLLQTQRIMFQNRFFRGNKDNEGVSHKPKQKMNRNRNYGFQKYRKFALKGERTKFYTDGETPVRDPVFSRTLTVHAV